MSKTNYSCQDTRLPDKVFIQTLIHRLSGLSQKTASIGHFNVELILQILHRYLKQPHHFIALPGGYSNQTYRTGPWVIRLPKAGNPIIGDPEAEIHHLPIAQRLELSPLCLKAYSLSDRLLITDYLPNLHTLADLNQIDHLKALAQLVKKLHYCDADFKENSETPLSFFDQSSAKFLSIQSLLTQEEHLLLRQVQQQCLKKLAAFHVKTRPAHGDLHQGNVVLNKGKLQLIDWESSGLADPAHDIARLFALAELNPKQQNIFLKAYHTYPPSINDTHIASLKQRIALAIPVHYLLVILWTKFAMRFTSLHDSKRTTLLEQTIIIYKQKVSDSLSGLNSISTQEDKTTQNTKLTFFQAKYSTSLPIFIPIHVSSPSPHPL